MSITNIYGAMNIGKMAILAQQTAIQVTGHNIANVNTEGYTRQKVMLEAGHPISATPGEIGTGVRVAAIQREYDSFLGGQIISEAGLLGKWSMKEEILTRAETAFNDNVGGGLSKFLSDFFNSWETLAANPANDAVRQTVISKGQILSDSFNQVSSSLNRLLLDIDDKILTDVDEVNRITAEIVELNRTIHEVENNNENANDLRDNRDRLIKELSGFIDISFYEASNNQVTVSTVQGRPLVVGQMSFNLVARTSASDASAHDVSWQNTNGSLTDITAEIQNGELGGLIDVRENQIMAYLNDIDKMAAEVVRVVNNQHVAGYGLDGSTGNNFFDPLTATGTVYTTNTGTGVVGSTGIADPEQVSTDRYELVFTSGGAFTLDNLTTGASSGTFTFTAGSPIAALQQRGINMTITGGPVAGDRFRISAATRGAALLSVNQTVVNDSGKVAAALDVGAGDGSNARQIGDIQTSLSMGRVGGASGTFTFEDFYNGLVGSIGNDTRNAIETVQLRESVKLQVENRREQVSGVSLDEEMINLIKFQHAYGAAAKLISTVDELLQDIINIVR